MKIDRKNNRIFTIGSTPSVIRRQRRLPFCFQRNGSLTGFTLIEIMVVVLIIIVITSVTIVAINNARNRTRDTIIITSLEQVQGIAETVYNPDDGYKELYKMRENKHPRIEEIRDRVDDMGRRFNFHFLEEALDYDGYDYCAYVRLFMHEDKVFCVDYSGVADTREVGKGETKINCQQIDSQYADCDYIK